MSGSPWCSAESRTAASLTASTGSRAKTATRERLSHCEEAGLRMSSGGLIASPHFKVTGTTRFLSDLQLFEDIHVYAEARRQIPSYQIVKVRNSSESPASKNKFICYFWHCEKMHKDRSGFVRIIPSSISARKHALYCGITRDCLTVKRSDELRDSVTPGFREGDYRRMRSASSQLRRTRKPGNS